MSDIKSRSHARRNVRAGAALLSACLASLAMSAIARAETAPMYHGADREAKILAGAKKEGQVVLYSAMIENQALRPLMQGFMKKYPFLRATYLRADDGSILSKVDAEVRSGHAVADVIEGTGVANAANGEGLLQPYFTPVVLNYPKSYQDPEHIWAPTRISYFGMAYNTRLVKADEIPKSYDDLLKPAYKGKLAWRIASISGAPLFITNLRIARGEARAATYLQALAQQNVVNFASGSARTLVDRVMAGEYPIALNIFAHHPLISAAKGAPVWTKLLDPTPSAASTIGVVRGATHPNASLLLIDYILSDEGQKILAQADYFPADPNVAPKPGLSAAIPKSAGVAEDFVDPIKLQQMDASSEKLFRQFFQH